MILSAHIARARGTGRADRHLYVASGKLESVWFGREQATILTSPSSSEKLELGLVACRSRAVAASPTGGEGWYTMQVHSSCSREAQAAEAGFRTCP